MINSAKTINGLVIQSEPFDRIPINGRVFFVAAVGMRVSEHRIVVVNVPGRPVIRKGMEQVIAPIAEVKPFALILLEKLRPTPCMDGV